MSKGKERRDRLLIHLIPNVRIKTSILAQRVGASISTIKRDLSKLTVEEHYPIDTIPGNNGGVVMREYKRRNSRHLSKEEVNVLNEVAQNDTVTEYQSNVLLRIATNFA